MGRQVGRQLSWLAFALLICCGSCSRDKLVQEDDTGPTGEDLQLMQETLTSQADYFGQLSDLAADQDTAGAYAQIVDLLASDSRVQWATNNVTGINILWANGLRGGLVLQPYGVQGMESRDRSPEPGTPRPATAAVAGVSSDKKALFLAPCYSEFELWDATIQELGDTCLTKAGFAPFEMYKDNECTLEQFRTIASGGYGVVRISSHGSPWPSDSEVEDVYLITGEVPTPESQEENWAFLETGMLGVIDYAGEQRYCITSPWFVLHNDFEESRPFLSNGFCFGGLGYWNTGPVYNAHAGGVLAWDWAVYAGSETSRIEHFFQAMCDTTRAEPLTASEWMEVANTYYMEEDRRITMNYVGDGDLTLWSRLRLERIEPGSGSAGTPIAVHGTGFGDHAGQLLFGTTPATQISSWAPGQIAAVVPDGLRAGVYPVKVVVGGEQSNTTDFTVGELAVTITPNPAGGAIGVPVDFEAAVSGGGPAQVKYQWEFGDQTPAEVHTAATVQHTFASEGTYTVTVRVLDDQSSEVLATGAGEAVIAGENFEEILHGKRYWYLEFNGNAELYDYASQRQTNFDVEMDFPVWAPSVRLRWSGFSFSADTLRVSGTPVAGEADSVRLHLEGTFASDGSGLVSGSVTEYRSTRAYFSDGRPLSAMIYHRALSFESLTCDAPRCISFTYSGEDCPQVLTEITYSLQAVSFHEDPAGEVEIDRHIQSVDWSTSGFHFSIR